MSDLRPSESKGCLEQRASFHINRSEVRRKQPGCVEVKGNRATYCSRFQGALYPVGQTSAPGGNEASCPMGWSSGHRRGFCRFQVFRLLPFPKYPRFPRVPLTATPTPNAADAASSVWKPTTIFSGRDLHNKSFCKIHKHKSFCRLPVLRRPFQFCISELFWTTSGTKDTFHETLPSVNALKSVTC